jgi:hypothetical protein
LRYASFWLQVCIFLAGQEVGTGFSNAREFTMTEDPGLGIIVSEILQKFIEGMLLSNSTGVGCLAVLVKTALIDYTQ